ncbi:hypothetical protein [endosymbiont of unidentified scaly snail isolate Monju]|uniref:hypothetical protein n=1 Tax=endosymbiont of unidentified scaly snail isolate Monju TaxID=1248727 RepID=UPI0005B852DF|nr:hypothetical protein [endosymbiont of unidentified scaly snail isolate Monju]
MSSPLHRNLRKLIGRRYRYLSDDWVLIDILGDEDCVALQRLPSGGPNPLQTDQYGLARRRVPETLTLPISSADDPDTYSEELLLLFSEGG